MSHELHTCVVHESRTTYMRVLREIGLLRDFLQEEVHESRTTDRVFKCVA